MLVFCPSALFEWKSLSREYDPITNRALGQKTSKGPIPSSIGLLTNLETLRLGSNGLTGSIPSGIGNCVQLLELDMAVIIC